MKGIGILAAEWLITSLIVYAGLSGKQILFINGPRTAVITLGIIGFAMCMIMPAIGKFISNAPLPTPSRLWVTFLEQSHC
jgi:hypothetical protein